MQYRCRLELEWIVAELEWIVARKESAEGGDIYRRRGKGCKKGEDENDHNGGHATGYGLGWLYAAGDNPGALRPICDLGMPYPCMDATLLKALTFLLQMQAHYGPPI